MVIFKNALHDCSHFYAFALYTTIITDDNSFAGLPTNELAQTDPV